MIEESYVSFDTALMLKESGFDMPCMSYYELEDGEVVRKDSIGSSDYNAYEDAVCSRPTQELAARWLRDVHDTFVKMERVGSFDGKEFHFYWSYSIISVSAACLKSISGGRYDSYEEALEVGIAKCLERIIEEMKE